MVISASVVTYNQQFQDIEPILGSLFASPVSIVYVIDHSDRGSCLKQELDQGMKTIFRDATQKIKYVRHQNNGYGGGNNVALKDAIIHRSTYHLVVNPDVWFDENLISELVGYLERNLDVAQIMPKILFPNGKIQRLAKMLPSPMDLFGRFCLPERLIRRRNHKFELRDSSPGEILNVPYLSGCFMLFRTKCLETVGMFDEHFFMYAEDIDITRRMHRHFKTVFYPDAVAYHKFNRASHRSLKLFWIHFTNIVKYFNKWGWFRDAERAQFNQRLSQTIHSGNQQQW